MSKKYANISAFILAGGESKRIGENKALLKIKNKTIIEIIADKLQKVFNDIFISANNNSFYSFLNYPVINDIIKNHGPISGIYSCLMSSKSEKNFFISCDLPLIEQKVIHYLIDNSNNYDVTIPIINEIPQYVCGVYSKNILIEIENVFNEKNEKVSIKNLIRKLNVNFVDIEKQKFYDKSNFINMNTKDDYKLIKKIYLEKLNEK